MDWEGPDGPTSRPIDKSIVVGSSPNADIHLADKMVSRVHAQLEICEDGIWVRDLRSSNGTWLQNIRIERALVPHLGRIRVGNTELIITHVRTAPDEPELPMESRFHGLLGHSRSMRALYRVLADVAPSNAPVLVLGETGTGKELVARAIHEASPRATGPLVVVDCAALPESLLDAELFGHVRGAFTGATTTREGALEAADGGTVFLDEIGELPKAMQPKLLRALEARTIRRIGENEHRPIDVRFVFATHRDLLKMVSTGEFREDLYFRIGVLPVRVPPLRERLEDLEMLVKHFLGDENKPIHPDVLAELRSRPWSGNVRELRNFVERMRTLGYERAVALTGQAWDAESPTSKSLPAVPTAETEAPRSASSPAISTASTEVTTQMSYRAFRDRWNDLGEEKYVRELLARHPNNVSAAAREAQLNRTYLYKLMRKHGL